MTLLKYARTSRKAPLYMLCWQLGFFLFGLLMVLMINTFVNEDRVYRGSVGLMMSAMAQRQELTKEEIQELRDILAKAEEERK